MGAKLCLGNTARVISYPARSTFSQYFGFIAACSKMVKGGRHWKCCGRSPGSLFHGS
jgi:hypothetical protein